MNDYRSLGMKLAALLGVVALLGGCAAASVALSKKDLDVQANTCTAIFVDPVGKGQRTVDVEGASGVLEFDRRALSSSSRTSSR